MSAVIIRACIALAVVAGASIPLLLHYLNRQRELQNAPIRPEYHDDEEEKQIICAICNQPMVESLYFILPCNHKFHKCCLKNVFAEELRYSRTCPYIDCRKNVRESVVSSILHGM